MGTYGPIILRIPIWMNGIFFSSGLLQFETYLQTLNVDTGTYKMYKMITSWSSHLFTSDHFPDDFSIKYSYKPSLVCPAYVVVRRRLEPIIF